MKWAASADTDQSQSRGQTRSVPSTSSTCAWKRCSHAPPVESIADISCGVRVCPPPTSVEEAEPGTEAWKGAKKEATYKLASAISCGG
jgi:hypothetical protein